MEDFLKLTPTHLDSEVPATSRDRESTREALKRWEAHPVVREALWIASPDFLDSLSAWRTDPESDRGRNLERALYRYMARMTARATPFGTFAGCGVGTVADRTSLELGPRGQYRRRSRLDMEYLIALAQAIAGDPVLSPHLRFLPNSSLHLAAGVHHHLQGRSHDGVTSYQLVATEPNEHIDATLGRAASGATAASLASAIVADESSITFDEALAFIGRLIASQVLVPDLAPPVTGRSPVHYMIGQLESAQLPEVSAALQAVAEKLDVLDRAGLGTGVDAYEDIRHRVSRLPGAFKPGRLIQVDMVKSSPAASLDERLVADILRACELIHGTQGSSEQTVFRLFKDEFRERYQDREVPLLEALDDEAGIGFEGFDNPGAEPLLDGMDFRLAATGLPSARPAGPILLRKLQDAWANRSHVLALDPELVEEMEAGIPLPMPDSFAAMGVVFNDTGGRQGFCLNGVIGSCGVNLAARFCHADDELAACVEKHLRAEEALRAKDVVFAEIAHLPEARTGNVVCRPVLRHYEIAFLATSGVPEERRIPLSDLTVSVRDDRIVLRSRRLGREVVPRLTSAHNFVADRSLKLYKFLCLLQLQGVTSDFAWQWGTLEEAAFLPRVAMNNIVFSLARWRVDGKEAAQLCEGTDAERLQRLKEWRSSRQLPRFAYIAELDNQLLIDFDNALAAEVFLEHIAKNPQTTLMEMFPPPHELPVTGPEGHFVHEVVLPIVRKPHAPDRAPEAAVDAFRGAPTASGEARTCMPGSEWLLAKLYCSPSHADRLLLELVRPLVKEVTTAQNADGWFFIRYGDPHWHLRLRFHGNPETLTQRVLPRLASFAEEQQRRGTLWRMQLDTYDRELERYGGPGGIGVAERLFQLDSELCLTLLALLTGDDAAERRWQLAFCGADRLLSGLGFTVKQKKERVERLATFFERDYLVDKRLKEQIARKFRDRRRFLAELLDVAEGKAGTGLLPQEAVRAFADYSDGLVGVRRRYRDLEGAGQLTRPLQEIAESLVHMHMNRLFRSAALPQESVIYEFLSRTYASKLAIGSSRQS